MNQLQAKLAIINAIGWEHDALTLSKMYLMHVLSIFFRFQMGCYIGRVDMLALDNYCDTLLLLRLPAKL
jgi:hypothetical protein